MKTVLTSFTIMCLLSTVFLMGLSSNTELVASASSSSYQGDLVLSGNNVTTIEGRFDINGSVIVEENATLILENAIVNLTQIEHYEHSIIFKNPANGNPRLQSNNSTITSDFSFMVSLLDNSSATIFKSTITSTLRHDDSAIASVLNSTIRNLDVFDSAAVSVSNSTISNSMHVYHSPVVTVSNSMVEFMSIASRSVVCSIDNFRSGFFDLWDYHSNSSVVFSSGGYAPSVTVRRTTINEWRFNFFGSSNVIVTDSTIDSVYSSGYSNVWLVNSTVPLVLYGSEGRVYVSWHLDVHVIDSISENIPFANVTATYPNSSVADSQLTDTNGQARLALAEKMMNATGEYTIGNYSVEAVYESYSSDTTVNMTENKKITMILDRPVNRSIARVHNLVTRLNYTTIQKAINAPETLDGHTVFVEEGTYYENVVVNKTLSLIGENRATTIVESDAENVMHITASNVSISCFTVNGSGTYPNSGIYLDMMTSGSNIRDNNIANNYYGIHVYSQLTHEHTHNIISGNNITENTSAGIYLRGSDFNIISGNNLTNNPTGIDDFASDYIIISDNNIICDKITDHSFGIHFVAADYCNISRNNIANYWLGVELRFFSDNNTISGNSITNNEFEGMLLVDSNFNSVFGNNITNNWGGIALDTSNGSRISANIITANEIGIDIAHSSNNTVYRNNIGKNDKGIYLIDFSKNSIYHNNFLNNSVSQVTISKSYNNTWDDSYPSGGNYWSDYSGTDKDGDCIGDTSFLIDENNQDNYPLMGMFSDFKTVWRELHITTICNSTIANFQLNYKESTIGFNVIGEEETIGFCRIMIPRNLMEGPYVVLVDGEPIDSIELPISNSTHAFLYFTYVHSAHEVMIVPELWYLYYGLLDKHTELLSKYNSLNQTYQGLQDQVDLLNSTLHEKIDSLNSTTQTSVDDFRREVMMELGNIRNLMYVLVATTIILIATTVYFAARKPKIRS